MAGSWPISPHTLFGRPVAAAMPARVTSETKMSATGYQATSGGTQVIVDNKYTVDFLPGQRGDGRH